MSKQVYPKLFTRDLCCKCNLDGDCFCQAHNQRECNNCGMGQCMRYNDRLREATQRGRNLEEDGND